MTDQKTPAAIPAGACDTHVHVFEPQTFPYSSQRSYTPGEATREHLQAHLTRCGLDRVILVQPSVYGTDNTAHASAMASFGLELARGVAVIDPDHIDETALDRLHAQGFRAARLNLQSNGIDDHATAEKLFVATEARLAARGWAIQIFTSLDMIAKLAPRIARSALPVIIDHFGQARPDTLAPLVDLLASDRAYIKLAAPYRVAPAPEFAAAAAMTRALVAVRPDRLLWGSDWPHPGGGSPRLGSNSVSTIEPFIPHDDAVALSLFCHWLGNARVTRAVLVENPERLFFAQ